MHTVRLTKSTQQDSAVECHLELPRSPNYVVCCSALKAPCSFPSWNLITICWDFPGHPVVKNLPSNAGDVGWIPGWGTEIPSAAGQLSLHTATRQPAHRSENPGQPKEKIQWKKVIGKKRIYLERKTPHRQNMDHLRS